MPLVCVLVPMALVTAGVVGRLVERGAGAGESLGYTLETRVRDADLLRAALDDLGFPSVSTGATVALQIDGAAILFARGEGDGLDATFMGTVPVETARRLLIDLHDAYASRLQRHVYARLLESASELGMALESEVVDRDLTVTLTFDV